MWLVLPWRRDAAIRRSNTQETKDRANEIDAEDEDQDEGARAERLSDDLVEDGIPQDEAERVAGRVTLQTPRCAEAPTSARRRTLACRAREGDGDEEVFFNAGAACVRKWAV